MRIGELSKQTGLSRDTIRFYERHGLIASVAGAEATNDYRDYPDELIERLQMIVEAREAGLSVNDLSTLTRHMEGGGDGSFDADAFLDEKIVEVRRTIERAERFLGFLEQTKAALAAGPIEWRED